MFSQLTLVSFLTHSFLSMQPRVKIRLMATCKQLPYTYNTVWCNNIDLMKSKEALTFLGAIIDPEFGSSTSLRTMFFSKKSRLTTLYIVLKNFLKLSMQEEKNIRNLTA